MHDLEMNIKVHLAFTEVIQPKTIGQGLPPLKSVDGKKKISFWENVPLAGWDKLGLRSYDVASRAKTLRPMSV